MATIPYDQSTCRRLLHRRVESSFKHKLCPISRPLGAENERPENDAQTKVPDGLAER